MYLSHYGLKDRPFKLAHDPAYYYSRAHQVPLNELCYSIEERQGLATLIGEPGTGKTTLLRRLLQSLDPHHHGILLSDASLGSRSIMRRLESALGITNGKHPGSEALRKFLTESNDKTVVVLIDEAQGLTLEQLEEVRFLSNLEAPGKKLLEIILAGQPPLSNKLASSACIALDQRVAVRCHLEPFNLDHCRAYIQHRLGVAQVKPSPIFTADAVKMIHERSRGIPRLINILCERCLIVGYIEETQLIDGAQVQEAISDLRMDQNGSSSSPKPGYATEQSLITRMGTRLEAIEGKLDALVQMLARGGFVNPEFADTNRARRWVESLKRGPQDKPRVNRHLQKVAGLGSSKGDRVKSFPKVSPSGTPRL